MPVQAGAKGKKRVPLRAEAAESRMEAATGRDEAGG